MKNRKRYYVILVVLLVMAVVCMVAIKRLSHMRGSAFVLINGFTNRFYIVLLKEAIAVLIIGVLCVRIVLKENRTKGFRIRLGIEISLLLISMLTMSVRLINNWESYRKEPYLSSPDGRHTLYRMV